MSETNQLVKSRLSKSKYVLGLQCMKALYLKVRLNELATEISASQQLVFDQGHETGNFAQKEFPDGYLVRALHTESQKAIQETQDAIQHGELTIFEATFEHDGVLVKVDILHRVNSKSAWQIMEVKSSTSVKVVHIQDAAIQYWVLKQCGLKVDSVFIQHLNGECEYPDLSNLFARVDVTKEVTELQSGIPNQLRDFKRVLEYSTAPETDIGPHCDEPYECAFKDHCWSAKRLPSPSVFDIPRLGEKKKWEFYRDGKIALKDIPTESLSTTQTRMMESSINNQRFVNEAGIQDGLKQWKYPLAFLDFETIAYAIPRFEGTRPYSQVPFQFSCQVQSAPDTKMIDHDFLQTDQGDPRRALAVALLKCIPVNGSVVAYNSGFEKTRINELAGYISDLAHELRAITERLVDPLPIIRAHVSDPKFMGSFSIKDTAPALLGDAASYEELDVAGGGEAQAAFIEMISTNTSPKRKKELEQGLREYCRKDTQVMAELVWWLQEQV
jgi:hypothetical protein